MGTQSKSICKKKKEKPSVNEHLAKLVIDDTDDSDGPVAIDSSDFEEEVFSSSALTRVKYPRSVIKSSIIETSDDPLVANPCSEDENGSVDALENRDVKQNTDKEVKNVDESVPPSSPAFDQYTDNMTQGSYLQSQATGTRSDADMFASGSEAGDEIKEDLNSSRNLLELDADIESMMEAALSEEEDKEISETLPVTRNTFKEQETIETQPMRGSPIYVEKDNSPTNLGIGDVTEVQRQTETVEERKNQVKSNMQAVSKKRVSVKVIPLERESLSPDLSCVQSSSSKLPEAEPPRSTRRTLRLRSKTKLI